MPSGSRSRSIYAELAAALPDAHVITIDAGHLIHGTAPAEFAGAVIPFLAER